MRSEIRTRKNLRPSGSSWGDTHLWQLAWGVGAAEGPFSTKWFRGVFDVTAVGSYHVLRLPWTGMTELQGTECTHTCLQPAAMFHTPAEVKKRTSTCTKLSQTVRNGVELFCGEGAKYFSDIIDNCLDLVLFSRSLRVILDPLTCKPILTFQILSSNIWKVGFVFGLRCRLWSFQVPVFLKALCPRLTCKAALSAPQ